MRALLLAGVAVAGLAQGARADVMFSLSNVAFVDMPGGTTPEGTLTGSFSTNDALSAITTFDLTASPTLTGTFPYPGYRYTNATATVTAATLPSQFFQLDAIGVLNDELRIYFTAPLTASGATILTVSSYEKELASGNRFPVGSIVAAAVAPTAVPEPASLALLGLGMAGLAAGRRRVG